MPQKIAKPRIASLIFSSPTEPSPIRAFGARIGASEVSARTSKSAPRRRKRQSERAASRPGEVGTQPGLVERKEHDDGAPGREQGNGERLVDHVRPPTGTRGARRPGS